MKIATGERVFLRKANLNDAGFLLRLLNQKSFIDNIRDKGIKTQQQAEEHIEQAYLIPYQIGTPAAYIVVEASSNTSIGVCGLYQRPFFNIPDLGYAFLDDFTGKGYASEAARLLMEYVRSEESHPKLSAITLESNTASMNLLSKAGFRPVGKIIIDDDFTPVVVFRCQL
ncbi:MULTISPECIES: GNAT family N-acetyltransferase [Pseudoalteromonas]|uniref:GNAT family N-acetyltransferase n=1 Tax=Pseudoalteromonas TaxID=53246 RepID=UPI000FFE7520|nr:MULTISPECIES: GNAT family N-acetyltransferase [Pseudoalteromonas]MCG9760129.1 GNAT family N-acetyltransferase [Pseudoalteromonas sp. Isolate6]NKC20754.1 GNAT family N-acetyltransferase [Pseudoalteromonas galatheae]RXE87056.1 N-acetyltransferase [Pseudoalteromonas sp. A757]